jgi:hypothetical protein
MTVGWIAERLAMGTRGYLNHLLYRRRKLGGEYTISRTDPFTEGPATRGEEGIVNVGKNYQRSKMITQSYRTSKTVTNRNFTASSNSDEPLRHPPIRRVNPARGGDFGRVAGLRRKNGRSDLAPNACRA